MSAPISDDFWANVIVYGGLAVVLHGWAWLRYKLKGKPESPDAPK